jgi:CubicO group peptidase (beta-lactamase class C family)
MQDAMAPLPRSTPEAQGIASQAILTFVEAAEKELDALHSIMLLRHGQVVAEGWWTPYAPEHPHMLFSLSKSFTATAVGLAVAEKLLTLDDRVLAYFPEDAPIEVGPNLAAMRVRHLLTMTTGHAQDTLRALFARADGNWIRAFLEELITHAPGSYFVYNNGATYMLAAIMQKVTGGTLLEYLQPRLLEPLGIAGAMWEQSPQGINLGGWGLNLRTEEIARFGQLYLQQGMWRGQQLVPATWVAEATSVQVDTSNTEKETDWAQGYGYQFWRSRHGGYRGSGAFGQSCIVMPQQDALLITTAGLSNTAALLDLVWKQLLPAMGPGTLPDDAAVQHALAQKLSSLALPLAQGEAYAPIAAQVSGRRYTFAGDSQPIQAAALKLDENGATFTLWNDRGEHQVSCGHGQWRLGITTLEARGPLRVATSAAWTDSSTYLMKLCYYETPLCATITCRFIDDRLFMQRRDNVSFNLSDPIEPFELEGIAS